MIVLDVSLREMLWEYAVYSSADSLLTSINIIIIFSSCIPVTHLLHTDLQWSHHPPSPRDRFSRCCRD